MGNSDSFPSDNPYVQYEYEKPLLEREDNESQKLFLDEYEFNLSRPLNNSYKLLDVIVDKGKDGAVLHIQNKHTKLELMLKLTFECKNIFIQVDKFVASDPNTELFARCYGMFVCYNLPVKWAEKIESKAKYFDTIIYGYFYEYSGQTLDKWLSSFVRQPIVDPPLFFGIMFEVLYAITWSFQRYGFLHRDLLLNNIMVSDDCETIREYRVFDKQFSVNTRLSVILIDFDNAVFTDPRINVVLLRDDIRVLFNQIQEKVSGLLPVYANFIEKLRKLIREDKYGDLFMVEEFKIFLTAPLKTKSAKYMNCHICGKIGVRALANRPSLRFCANDECVLKLGEIAHMI